MLQKETLKFLKDLKKNNNKPWFEEHRKQYEAAKTDFENLTVTVLKATAKFDPTIANLQPKDCLFRINRDVRFSKDKSPYKTNFGMSISKDGKKAMRAGYYLHCEPGEAFVGGGIWMPMAPELKKVRQEIDYNWNEFEKLLQDKKFKTVYNDLLKDEETSLTRPPKGYDETNPAIDYLKLKSFLGLHKLTDEELLSDSLLKTVTTSFEALKPLLDFMNRAIEN
jgi:uncharacterized protein (TIGR02453 family)